MKKKLWKRMVLVLVIFVVGSAFFGTVYWIQRQQKQVVETKNNGEDKIENYKSGETITLSDVYQEADVDQITYIAFQLQKAVESENKYDHSIYFVKKSDLVEQILNQLEEKNVRREIPLIPKWIM